jgi:Uncharacterized proteins, LmbE homologs
MRILVVSPHPDDETLGAGGTLLKMKKMGHQIFWLNVTDMKRDEGWEEKLISRRREQIERIKEFYNFEGFYNLSLPPTKLSGMDEGEVIGEIKKVLKVVEPEWLMLPGWYDAHSDHHVVYNCCMACSKSFRAPYIKRITTMEIISETDYGYNREKFVPNLFVDITDELEGKLEAMRIYDTEIQEMPFPRNLENIRALAQVRGGTCQSRYAEAFFIVKQIE